ncbi:trypsin-like peptidase domain-containing protein [Patescibacteria group bacterium]|nr:trypsin-like peptidase domain-containing protein [Patescibacteria group bacterium]
MSKNILKIIVIFVIGMVGGIFADQILWPYFGEGSFFYNQLANFPVSISETKKITIQENVALQEAVEKIEKAVVGVRTKLKSGKILSGSGLIVTSDGLIVTLAELVPRGEDFVFFVDGKTPNWQILKRDSKTNLALIKVEEKNLATVGFADFDELRLGERVFLVGVIWEKTGPLKMVNEGIVKFFSQDEKNGYIRTNIFEKNTLSGSALFNIKGELLGLNTIDSGGKVTAIPISKIRDFIGF